MTSAPTSTATPPQPPHESKQGRTGGAEQEATMGRARASRGGGGRALGGAGFARARWRRAQGWRRDRRDSRASSLAFSPRPESNAPPPLPGRRRTSLLPPTTDVLPCCCAHLDEQLGRRDIWRKNSRARRLLPPSISMSARRPRGQLTVGGEEIFGGRTAEHDACCCRQFRCLPVVSWSSWRRGSAFRLIQIHRKIVQVPLAWLTWRTVKVFETDMLVMVMD